MVDNPPRVLPNNTFARIDVDAWPLPAEFKWLKEIGELEIDEMARTFNCGIGMIAIVAKDKAKEAITHFQDVGETAWVIGTIENSDGPPYVELTTREL